jgi:hypothetical protein
VTSPGENPLPSAPPELEFNVASFADGTADRTLRIFAAQGLLPLGIEDRLRTLLAVARDADPEIAVLAKETLARISPDEWGLLLDLSPLSAREIETLSEATEDPGVLEPIVRHSETSDAVLIRLARKAEGSVQEALVVNQRRLLAHPDLIDALESNPALTPESRRLLGEMREEFFEKSARRRAAEEEAAAEAARTVEAARVLEASEAELALSAGETGAAPAAEGEEELTDERRMALHQRLAYMNVAQRIDTATKGTREERRVLITSVLKPIWEAVLKSPFLTDVELEAFASMRNVDEEVYRRMAAKADWVRKYAVVLALIKNPKVPPEVGMSLVKFLRLRDLKAVMNDRNLPEPVRIVARKLYLVKRS